MSHDGRGIGDWHGKTLFVDNALPGERVEALLLREQGKFAEAVATTVIEAAPTRVEPPCAHYSRCGGCQLQHLAPEQQLAHKQSALLDQLQRWAGLEPEQVLAPITSASQGYRNRARLAVWYNRDGSVTFGFRERQSRRLTPIKSCWVLTPELNALILPLSGWLAGLQAHKAVTHVELVADAEGAALIVRHVRALTDGDRAGLGELAVSAKARVWLDAGADGLTALDGEPCDPRLQYRLDGEHPDGDLRLSFHPGDFIQINPAVNRAMVSQALDLLAPTQDDRVLDLFCGIGNFTLPLARRAGEVLGVEGVASMVARAHDNARANGIERADFVRADLADIDARRFERERGKIDAILLDPPRDGAQAVVEHVGQLSARRLVYVSCNPATLARDAKILAAQGFRLQSLGVLDMFPHTAHVESMALFVRA